VGARGLDLALLGAPAPTMCFNWDGGRADQFVTAVTGTERFTIDLTGIASHAGSRPADGGMVASRKVNCWGRPMLALSTAVRAAT